MSAYSSRRTGNENLDTQQGTPPSAHYDAIMAPSAQKTKKSDQAFRTISEVADLLGLQQHVLRFWETKFTALKPLKRGGGRRYYRPEDVALIARVQTLLYDEGYTIKGVQKMLRAQGKKAFIADSSAPKTLAAQPVTSQEITEKPADNGLSLKQTEVLRAMLAELRALRNTIAQQ